MTPALLPLLLLAAPRAAAAPRPAGETVISQSITIRAKSSGPSVSVPPPSPTPPVVDEVLGSLSLGRGAAPAPPERVRVAPDAARLDAPFPAPPFLALSPENIRALYDAWTFEVLDSRGNAVRRRRGVGRLRGALVWDGNADDGLLALAPGRSYRYRFTGRRGGRAFVVESEPARIGSFSRTDFSGETRLEAAADLVFVPGSARFSPAAGRYLDAMTAALRAAGPRQDGTYRLELDAASPRGRLARSRAAALAARLAASIPDDLARVKVAVVRAARAPAVAALVPPAAGPALRIK